jgi:hypothetical protein
MTTYAGGMPAHCSATPTFNIEHPMSNRREETWRTREQACDNPETSCSSVMQDACGLIILDLIDLENLRKNP